MRKRIIAFYDVLLFAIICSPMIVVAVILLFMLVTKGTSEWIHENWYSVVIFAITFMVPIGGTMMFRYCVTSNNFVHFHYFAFTKSWKNAIFDYFQVGKMQNFIPFLMVFIIKTGNFHLILNLNYCLSELCIIYFRAFSTKELGLIKLFKQLFSKSFKL